MPATTFIGHFLGPDTHASRPAASGLPNGTLYVCSTHNKIERVVSGAWADYATLGGGAAADTIYDAKGDLVAGTGADAADRLAVGTDGQVLTADSTQSTGVKWAPGAAGALTLLSSTTLASPGTFDITGISGGYSDLIVVIIARGVLAASFSDNPKLRLNGITTGIHYMQVLQAAAATVTSPENIGTGSFQSTRVPAASAPANIFGTQVWTFPGYSSTAWHKTVLVEESAPINTASAGVWVARYAGLWASTAAINRVAYTGGSDPNLVAGSQIRIYGRT